MKNLILSLDQGTTGSTALLMDLKGKIIASENTPFKQIFPKVGWVEHDPNEILKSLKTSIKKVFQKSGKSPKSLLTIGVTNQRETIVFWDRKTGKPISNAIVWQCRRTSKRTDQIKALGDEPWIREKTGLSVDPYFSSTKIEWFLKKYKKKKDICIGTIDSFLIWNLTDGRSFYTEPSNASRTQLLNLKTLNWDSDLLDYFGVSSDFLPEVIPSNSNFGEVSKFAPLVDGTPITGVLGDQQSSLFGHGAFKEGELKSTYGTGSFVLLNTGPKIKKSKHGLLSTLAWSLKGQKPVYALEGGAFNCASCLNWAKEEMGLFEKSSDVGVRAAKVKDSGGVLFAPTFSGIGAPYWEPQATGAFLGLTRGAKNEHLCRAILEGLSFQNDLIFKALKKDLGRPLSKVYIDGGASKSDEFMRIQAKFSSLKLIRPQSIETTALGACFMAGLGVGAFKSLSQLKTLNPSERLFNLKPDKEIKALAEDYKKLFKALGASPFIRQP